MITQVKTFDDVMSSQEEEVNSFLEEVGSESIISVTPMYNTILGGVIYTVVYSKTK